LVECLGGCFEAKAFSGGVIEALDIGAQLLVADGIEVGFARKASGADGRWCFRRRPFAMGF
jgi:hypothetical protein